MLTKNHKKNDTMGISNTEKVYYETTQLIAMKLCTPYVSNPS